jgi:sarcosine oxidase
MTGRAPARVAVVGAGVVGMSATAALLARGADVTCYERAGDLLAERSAGSSRIFRLAHASSDLVRLAQRAQAGFRAWADQAGMPMVGEQECVVSQPDLRGWAAAMEAAEAPFCVVEAGSKRLRIPAVVPQAAALVDPMGGVIDVDAVRAVLTGLAGRAVVHEAVSAVENTSSGVAVHTTGEQRRFDVVLLAAGAGSPALAAQVGIDLPPTLAHHVRFTFRVDDTARWQCWIDKPACGMSTYQHHSRPGSWAVGGDVGPAATAWEVGRDAATRASREAVTGYVREKLGIRPDVLDSLYCTTVPGVGDGFTIHRSGAVLGLSGGNLFKFAPLLGDALADACLSGATPTARELAR